MSWQEWLGSLLMLLGIGGIVILLAEALCCLLGIVILLAEALCCLLGLDRKRPEPEEFDEPTAGTEDTDYMQNRVRQLRAMAKHRAATTETDADAVVAQIEREIEAEAARIARRCEVRR
jgi:hypothetical protein